MHTLGESKHWKRTVYMLTGGQIPFWMTLIIVDAALDTAIFILCTYSVWRLDESYLQRTLGTLLLSPMLM